MGLISSGLSAVAAIGGAAGKLADWANARLQERQRTEDKQTGVITQQNKNLTAENEALREGNQAASDAMAKTPDEALDANIKRAEERAGKSS